MEDTRGARSDDAGLSANSNLGFLALPPNQQKLMVLPVGDRIATLALAQFRSKQQSTRVHADRQPFEKHATPQTSSSIMAHNRLRNWTELDYPHRSQFCKT